MVKIISNMVQVHIAAKLEKNDEFRFLILQRSALNSIYPLLWQVITGTIEKGETAIQTAIREIKEETGLTPLKLWAIPYISSFYDYNHNLVNTVPVFGVQTKFIEKIRLSDEHQDYKWISFKDCLEILPMPQQIEAMKIFYDFILCRKQNSLFQIKDY